MQLNSLFDSEFVFVFRQEFKTHFVIDTLKLFRTHWLVQLKSLEASRTLVYSHKVFYSLNHVHSHKPIVFIFPLSQVALVLASEVSQVLGGQRMVDVLAMTATFTLYSLDELRPVSISMGLSNLLHDGRPNFLSNRASSIMVFSCLKHNFKVLSIVRFHTRTQNQQLFKEGSLQ